MNASTFTARVVASTGADVAAALSAGVGALSGPLHGGAPSRVLHMLDEVEAEGDAERWVKRALDSGRPADGLRPPRLPRRGPARPRAAPDRARDRSAAARGRGAARAGRAGRAEGAQAGPRAGHERRVLVGGGARLRRRAARAVHADVLLRARRRLGRAHPRAEARGPADPADRQVRRDRARGQRTRSTAPRRADGGRRARRSRRRSRAARQDSWSWSRRSSARPSSRSTRRWPTWRCRRSPTTWAAAWRASSGRPTPTWSRSPRCC